MEVLDRILACMINEINQKGNQLLLHLKDQSGAFYSIVGKKTPNIRFSKRAMVINLSDHQYQSDTGTSPIPNKLYGLRSQVRISPERVWNQRFPGGPTL